MNELTPEDRRPLSSFAVIPAGQRCGSDADWFPAVDILEDDDEYLFLIDLPDVRPNDIRVSLEGNGLFISGERLALPAADKKSLRTERPLGHFERRFELPDDVNRTNIDSIFQNGILELHVGKISSARPNSAAKVPPKLRLRPAA